MGTFGHLIFKYHHEVGCSSELCLELLLSSRRGFEGRHYKNNQQSILLYQLLSRILSRLWKYLPRLLQCRLQKPWLSWLQSRQAQLLAPVRQTPVPVPALDSTPGTQYHFQDNNGNINYGYSNINSAKHEVGNTYSGVQGEYSYVDANGIQQMVSYVADEGGFRIISDSRLQALEALAPKVPMLADQSIPAAEPLKASPETRRKREAEAYYGFGYGAPYYGHRRSISFCWFSRVCLLANRNLNFSHQSREKA